jgi:hypothetical protein
MFLKKGAGMHQKGGQCLPFEGKRGSRQIYNTKMYQPSFSLVSVGKIPRKYQPIPTKIPNRETTLMFTQCKNTSLPK